MEADRKLLYPFFEGYKFDSDNMPTLDYYPLEQDVFVGDDANISDFHILADRIYENKLKSTESTFYYLNKEKDLVSFCKKTLKSEIISGPFDCFNVTISDLILFNYENQFKLIKKSSSSEQVTFSTELKGEIKILELKMIGEGGICALIQAISKKEEQKADGEVEVGDNKSIFSFYKLNYDGTSETCECELLGWSRSRPLISFIGDDRIIIGTCEKIKTRLDERVDTTESVESVENVSTCVEIMNVFDDDDETMLNNCIIHEFKNGQMNTLTELILSGSYMKNDHLASKYLYDVIICDLAEKMKHVTTFPALNFIQTGKIDKKYSVFGRKYAFVIESGGNVYCYAKPADRNAKTSAQYLVQLDEEVNGWSIDGNSDEDSDEVIHVLGSSKIFKITMK